MEASTATSPELLVNGHLSEEEKDFEGEGIATSVQEEGGLSEARKFDWNAHWYPVAVVADLDKRVPTAVRILARDLVVWWDRHGKTWQVWDDRCPHRLAPLSEGRINEKGELQCSYHGWCFAPCSGDCTCIPQASKDGNPVWKSKRASAAVYPSVAQEGILWFWPDTRPEFQGIMDTNPPPSLPALADLTFTDELASRNLNYGYEQLIENLMDPAHVPFAHHGLQGNRNMAVPINLKVDKLENSGFTGMAARGPAVFTAPCIFTMEAQIPGKPTKKGVPKKVVMIFICIPVSPGQSKLIWAFRRNFSLWMQVLMPRWYLHIRQMLVLDSDLYLLHVAERKLEEAGSRKWETVCYVPTKSDAFVIAFRKWLRVYAGGKPDWNGRYDGLPPTPHREMLMDRYWTHVKVCRHCTAALKVFEGAESFLQVVSVGAAAMLGMAALKPSPQVRSWSIPLAGGAVLATVASRWLSNFVKKTYHYHDYNHALVK
ncbi:hypothetical protein GOP47_0018205 [Adiantum capillus-veneris]|uniref:Rieske domain-containing protein n=1 Tax=Adiantum capillus-veneris TaxID=13818 RepID=A0A9D4UGH9_ADICA|nr:hypothetical protein GOP47_0017581 [Adiantum capillus-veneris]KAI5067677.1 hypothetical protein GOP47_0018205 [Adiantum capillus-veneris]